jgi:protein-S-isoprenylcysteine O-methyltransferase Ste14
MRFSWNTGWASWASDAVLFAWVVAAMYVLGSALFTNRIKRREPIPNRLLDTALLWGGYFLMFSQAPFLGPLQLHFLPAREPLQIAGVVLAYVGLPLTIWSRARLGRYWSGVVALKHDHRLIQSGPYRMVRRPLYTGLILGAFGWCLCITTWSSLLGAFSLMTCFERRAHKEDALLASEFGAEFEAYR